MVRKWWYGGPRHRVWGLTALRHCILDFTMGGRDTTHLEHRQRKTGCLGVRFWPFLGRGGVSHGPKVVVWWSKTQSLGVDSIEALHTRFYYGREGYYPLRASK